MHLLVMVLFVLLCVSCLIMLCYCGVFMFCALKAIFCHYVIENDIFFKFWISMLLTLMMPLTYSKLDDTFQRIYK